MYRPFQNLFLIYQECGMSEKSKKSKKRVDLDVRPEVFFSNYDYGGPEDGDGIGPGTGLYHGDMSKYKSVKEFIERSRKRRAERRKQAWLDLLKKYNPNA